MTVYVVTHKPLLKLNLPTGYQPILVGAVNKENPQHFITDADGDNISDLNPQFCELTAVYNIWKNRSSNNVGLVHYRRFFSEYHHASHMYWATLIKGTPKPIKEALLSQKLNDGYDWVLATLQVGGQGSLWDQFAHFHHEKDMLLTRQIIQDRHPETLVAFDQVMKQPTASFYNMFYTSKHNLEEYCQWLFDVLFHVQKLVDMTGYDQYQQRLYGFLSERLLNVWVNYKQAKVEHLVVYNSEHMKRIDAARLIKHQIMGSN